MYLQSHLCLLNCKKPEAVQYLKLFMQYLKLDFL